MRICRHHLDHVHGPDTADKSTSAPQALEPDHGAHDALDDPVFLRDEIVELLRLPYLRYPRVATDTPRCRLGGRAVIDGDVLGQTVRFDGTPKEARFKPRSRHTEPGLRQALPRPRACAPPSQKPVTRLWQSTESSWTHRWQCAPRVLLQLMHAPPLDEPGYGLAANSTGRARCAIHQLR